VVPPRAASTPGSFDWIGKHSLTFAESKQLLASFSSGYPLCKIPNHGPQCCFAAQELYDIKNLMPEEQASRQAFRSGGESKSRPTRGGPGGPGGPGRGASSSDSAAAASNAANTETSAAGAPIPPPVPPVTGVGQQASLDNSNT
jgi:hypothetical protein